MTVTDRRISPAGTAPLTATQLRRMRVALLEQRDFRLEQLAELNRDDARLDGAIGEVTASLSHAARFALTEIDAALERLRHGVFGRCAACAEQIPIGRLEILPMAALCVSCQRTREHSGEYA